MACSFQVSQQHFDSIGTPLDGAKLYCYSGTDLHNTYSDSGLTILNTNPIILNGRGDCDVYWDGSDVRFDLYDSDNVFIRSWNGISSADGYSKAESDGRYGRPYTSPLNTSTIDNTNWTIEQTNRAVKNVTAYNWTTYGQWKPSESSGGIFSPTSSHIRFVLPSAFAQVADGSISVRLHGTSEPVLTKAVSQAGVEGQFYHLAFDIPDEWVSTGTSTHLVDYWWSGSSTPTGEITKQVGTNPTTQRVVKEMAWKEDLDAHVNNRTNPHHVTAAQVDAYTKSEADSRFAPTGTYATQTYVNTAVSTHANRIDNPHMVTAAQVGAMTSAQVSAAINTELNTRLSSYRTISESYSRTECDSRYQPAGTYAQPYTSPLATSTINNTTWTVEQTNKAVDTVTTYTWTNHGQFDPSQSTSFGFYPFSSHIRFKIPESFAPESTEYMTLNLHGGSSPVTHSLMDAIHESHDYYLYFEIPDAWVSTEESRKMVDITWGGKTTAGTINEEWGTNPTSSQQVRTMAWNDDVITKQPTLVSGYNVKTINGNSILGSGDLDVTPSGTKIAAAKSISLEARAYTLQERIVAGWVIPAHSICWGAIRFYNMPAFTGEVYLVPMRRSDDMHLGTSQNFTTDCRTNGVHAHYQVVNNTDTADYIDIAVGGTFTAAGNAIVDANGITLKLK